MPVRRAKTPDRRENELISKAFDLVEKKMDAGTASSQEVVHFLKLGSSREKLEQHRIELEGRLMEEKIESMKSAQRVEELYGKALDAMRSYQGQPPLDMLELEADDDY